MDKVIASFRNGECHLSGRQQVAPTPVVGPHCNCHCGFQEGLDGDHASPNDRCRLFTKIPAWEVHFFHSFASAESAVMRAVVSLVTPLSRVRCEEAGMLLCPERPYSNIARLPMQPQKNCAPRSPTVYSVMAGALRARIRAVQIQIQILRPLRRSASRQWEKILKHCV